MAESGVPGPFLVVVPLSLLHNWYEQIKIFAPDLPCVMYYGTSSERMALRKQVKFKDLVVLKDETESYSSHSNGSSSSKNRKRSREIRSVSQNTPPCSKKLPINDIAQHQAFSTPISDESYWKAGFLSITFNQSPPSCKSYDILLNNVDETLKAVISRKRFSPSKELLRNLKNLNKYPAEYLQAIHSLSAPEAEENLKLKCKKTRKLKVPKTFGEHENNPDFMTNLERVIEEVVANSDESLLSDKFHAMFSSGMDQNSASFCARSGFTGERIESPMEYEEIYENLR